MKIFGIYRERIFSPGKVHEDAAILDAVLQALRLAGHETLAVPAEAMNEGLQGADLILSMAQSDRVLGILEKGERSGIPVVNTVSAVRNCYRKALIGILSRTSIPMPAGRIVAVTGMEASGDFREQGEYWLKRGDLHALGPGDVARINSPEELPRALAHFRGQGVEQVLVQEHVDGPCVKFYGVGVESGCFFRAFLAASGEEITGRAGTLSDTASAAARHLGLEIYGGDAIRTPDGAWVLIDLNDWPTFSLCREAAARAIIDVLEGSGAIKGVSNGNE
jgi:glutathione synthase/RimK-type ligase-like ATP-grasp enzyme